MAGLPTIEKIEDGPTATLTAVAGGETTIIITVTATSTDGSTQTATCEVVVKTRTEGVTFKDEQSNPDVPPVHGPDQVSRASNRPANAKRPPEKSGGRFSLVCPRRDPRRCWLAPGPLNEVLPSIQGRSKIETSGSEAKIYLLEQELACKDQVVEYLKKIVFLEAVPLAEAYRFASQNCRWQGKKSQEYFVYFKIF